MAKKKGASKKKKKFLAGKKQMRKALKELSYAEKDLAKVRRRLKAFLALVPDDGVPGGGPESLKSASTGPGGGPESLKSK